MADKITLTIKTDVDIDMEKFTDIMEDEMWQILSDLFDVDILYATPMSRKMFFEFLSGYFKGKADSEVIY